MLGGNDTIIALLRDVVQELRELNKLLREAVCQSRGVSRDELMAALPAIEERIKAEIRRGRSEFEFLELPEPAAVSEGGSGRSAAPLPEDGPGWPEFRIGGRE